MLTERAPYDRLVPLVALGFVVSLGVQAYLVVRLTQLQASVQLVAMRTDLALSTKKAVSTARPAGVYVNNCEALTAEDVRGVVREELQSTGQCPARNSDAEDGEPSEKDTVVVRDPMDNAEAFTQASRLITDALATRLWSDQQSSELRSLKPRLTPDQLQPLVEQLIAAINRQEVRVEASMPF